ncbi:odorant receptor Or1-like [Vespa mandarinia]|uniref:odorant receptor Or1-like n=1 Tax=Vespa mandarinia TaxID=7446 RepID=UPI0016221532|nr:odorant receptor Or1-like [Vespa mandarinia]
MDNYDIEKPMQRWIEPNFHLNVSVSIIYYMGTWPPLGKYRSLYIIYTICSFTFMLGIFLLTEIANLILSLKDLEKLIAGATLLMTNCTHAYKIIIILYRQKRIQNLLDITKNEIFVRHNIKYEYIVTQYTWKGIFHHIAYQSFGTVAVLCWGFTPIADLIAGRSRRLPMEGWYPYNVTVTPAFEITSLHQAVAIFVACFHNVAMDTLVTGLITVACCQLSILSQTVTSIENYEREEKSNIKIINEEKNCYDVPYEMLKRCIIHNNVIFSFTNEIQDIFGTMILLQFFVNCIIICLIAFNISQMKIYIPAILFGMLMYMCCMTYQIFIYCWHGNELQLHNIYVSTAAYSNDWWNAGNHFKRALQIMIIRAHRPLILSAGKVFTLSLNTFVNVSISMNYILYKNI